MSGVFKALSDPTRRRVLQLLHQRPMSAGEIAEHFPVSRTAVSQHLTLLKGAGLLDERRDGTRRLYRARPEGLAELHGYLDEFWGAGLWRLKTEAERSARRTRRATRNRKDS